VNPTSAVECADWYEATFHRGAVVLFDEHHAALAEQADVEKRPLDALTTLRWLSRAVDVAPRLLALAANGATAVVLHLGVDAMTGDVCIEALPREGVSAREQLAALGLPSELVAAEGGGKEQFSVPQESLALVLAFAVVAASEAPGEERPRPPAPDAEHLPLDIYSSEFIGLATSFGAPLETIWHVDWELQGIRWCLLNADLDVEDTHRIPYRQALPAPDFLKAIRACNEAGLRYLTLPVLVVTGPGSGHVIHVETIDDHEVVYHDPWPGRSMLAAENNALGIAARSWQGPQRRWCVTPGEFQRAAYASLVEPAVWLSLCGVRTYVIFSDLAHSDFFGFFHFREIGRANDEEQKDVTHIGLEPGNWQEHIALTVNIDAEDTVRSAVLSVERSWLSAPETTPFAFDLLQHFVATFVTEADADETRLLSDALRSISSGGLVDCLAAGPPHLLTQFRLIAMTVAGAAPFARATLPCSTVRALNGTAAGTDESRLIITISRPKYEAGVLVEDQETGYFMDDYRAYLWSEAQTKAQNLVLLGHT
jgi:hypothetical protein